MYLAYTGRLNGEDGSPVAVDQWADPSVDVYGTLGVGGSLRWEGSNKAEPNPAVATDWHPLTDPQGNDLNFAALKVEAVTEVIRWARPRVTAGDGTTSLECYVTLRRPNPMRA